jgi:hypothetical protein
MERASKREAGVDEALTIGQSLIDGQFIMGSMYAQK